MKRINNQGFSHTVLAVAFAVVFGISGVAYMVASYADTKSTSVRVDSSLHVVVKDACEWSSSRSGFTLRKITEDVLWPQIPKYTQKAYDVQINTDGNWNSSSTLTVRSQGNPDYPGYPGYFYQNIPDGDVGNNGFVLHLNTSTTYHVRVIYSGINTATSGTDTFRPVCVPPPMPHYKTPTATPTGKPSSSSPASAGSTSKNTTTTKSTSGNGSGPSSSKSPSSKSSGSSAVSGNPSSTSQPQPHQNIIQRIRDFIFSIF